MSKNYLSIFMFNFSKYSYSVIAKIYKYLQKDIASLEESKDLIEKVTVLKSPQR